MCLIEPCTVHEDETSGYGWKVVRKTYHPGEYRPLFEAFYKSGEGGCMYVVEDEGREKCTVVYRDDEEYVVEHGNIAKALNGVPYPAGVHLYRDLNFAGNELRKYQERLREDLVIIRADLVIKRFQYSEAVACDDEVMVAMRATPQKGEVK